MASSPYLCWPSCCRLGSKIRARGGTLASSWCPGRRPACSYGLAGSSNARLAGAARNGPLDAAGRTAAALYESVVGLRAVVAGLGWRSHRRPFPRFPPAGDDATSRSPTRSADAAVACRARCFSGARGEAPAPAASTSACRWPGDPGDGGVGGDEPRRGRSFESLGRRMASMFVAASMGYLDSASGWAGYSWSSRASRTAVTSGRRWLTARQVAQPGGVWDR